MLYCCWAVNGESEKSEAGFVVLLTTQVTLDFGGRQGWLWTPLPSHFLCVLKWALVHWGGTSSVFPCILLVTWAAECWWQDWLLHRHLWTLCGEHLCLGKGNRPPTPCSLLPDRHSQLPGINREILNLSWVVTHFIFGNRMLTNIQYSWVTFCRSEQALFWSSLENS